MNICEVVTKRSAEPRRAFPYRLPLTPYRICLSSRRFSAVGQRVVPVGSMTSSLVVRWILAVDILVERFLLAIMSDRLAAACGVLWTLLIPGVTLAQGVVSFNNIQGVDNALRPLLMRYNGDPLSKATGRIQILNQSGALIVNPNSGMTTFGLALDGLFGLGHLSLPPTEPGGSTQVTLQVWDSSSGETYESASEKVAVPLSLVGLGGGALPVPNLLEISTPKTYPKLPPGVSGLTLDPLQSPDQNYLKLSARVRPYARYRLEVSADLSLWNFQQDVLTGSMTTPPNPSPEWGVVEIISTLPTHSVTYFRLVGVGGE